MPSIIETLVSIDGEFTGLIPGPHSMISLGCVAYNADGSVLSKFSVNMHELPGSTRYPDTMQWWKTQPEAWKIATTDAIDPAVAMQQFDNWLRSLPGRPKVIGWPLPVDFMFVYWYYAYFMNTMPPFGFNGIDIKSFAMAKLGKQTLTETSMSETAHFLGLPSDELSHDALDDACRQGKIYFALMNL